MPQCQKEGLEGPGRDLHHPMPMPAVCFYVDQGTEAMCTHEWASLLAAHSAPTHLQVQWEWECCCQ
jgi:hypothetical protein